MHAILAGAEIHRTDGHPFHDRLHLVEREAVRPAGIAVAESAGEITFVGKPEPERNSTVLRHGAPGGRRMTEFRHRSSTLLDQRTCRSVLGPGGVRLTFDSSKLTISLSKAEASVAPMCLA